MKVLREYNTELKNRMLIPEEVITELSFDETTSYPRVSFSLEKDTRWTGDVSFSRKLVHRLFALQKEKEQQIKEITRQAPLSTVAALEGPVGDARGT